MKRVYNAATVEQCVDLASSELKIPKASLNYTVLEEKKGLFKKIASISVDVPERYQLNENDGTVQIVDGKIIIKDPKENGKPASISASKACRLVVDGTEIKTRVNVTKENIIEVEFEENISSRNLDIKISDDKTEAYIDIKYSPEVIFGLESVKENNYAMLEPTVVKEVWPPKYQTEEIKQELKKNGILYGIIEENVKKCCDENRTVTNVFVAKGDKPVNGEDDRLDIKFKTEQVVSNFSEDNSGNIDFKSIGSIEAVSKGEILAIKVSGTDGKDGKDIYGRNIKHNPGKRINIKASQGCIAKDSNTIVAAIDGKPCIKGNTFYVFEIHEIFQDVDLKTGNIKFIGDVIIHGNVREGMMVEAGNSIEIYQSVERAQIIGKGNINIKGNVIASSILGGGEDLDRLRHLKTIEEFDTYIRKLIETIEQVKKFNLLGYDTPDGQVVKVLIENKFKVLNRICLSIISENIKERKLSNGNEDILSTLIKQKLIGLAPLNIKHYSELFELGKLAQEKLQILKASLAIPVNVRLAYCQDSNISSSGDVYFEEKGSYVSNITAQGSVIFNGEKSVVRGGIIKAESQIKCSIVGSNGGVVTKLIVNKEGHIYANTAFENTQFIVGSRELSLEYPCKNIHAYIGEDGDLVVDKLKL